MSLPSGASVAQGVGVPTEYAVKAGRIQRSYPAGCASTGSRGMCVVHTSNEGEVDLSADTATKVAGVLGQDVYDPSSIPASVADNIYADGILTYSRTGAPVSVWKNAEIYITQINGSVTYGQFLIPDNSGKWKASNSNTITNGAVVAMTANTVSGGPVLASVNLA